MEAKVAIDSNFRGNTYTYVQNTALQHNPSYYLVNPRLSLSGPDNNPWKITAWCKNCTDHHYYGEIFNDASAVIGFPAAPRTFGVTLSYQSD